MTRILAVALAIAATTGCIIHDGPDPVIVDSPAVIVETNIAPWVDDAAAGCFYDAMSMDDIWYFEALVDDPDGVFDVAQVWADVYDDRSGELVQSFELYPTNDPYLWYSDWLASSTWLNCWYDLYSVDIVAYDQFDDWSAVTVLPLTY